MSGAVALDDLFLHYDEPTLQFILTQSHARRPAAKNTHYSTKSVLIRG